MGDSIEDEALARELVVRLNRLIEDSEVREDISSLLGSRIPVSPGVRDHPTIQISMLKESGRTDAVAHMGFLGLLNGLVGIRNREPRKLWGFIQAEVEDDGSITAFKVDSE